MSTYDKYYKKENYFGNPYPELLEYVNGLSRNYNILDIGCGQGRDTIALGRLGFTVMGVDVSNVGIKQLNHIALQEKLNVKGIVANFNELTIIGDYDIILLDSIFHFYTKDMEQETDFLYRLINQMKVNGRLVIVMQYHAKRFNAFNKIVEESKIQITREYEKVFVYKEFNSRFIMVVLKK